MKVKLKSQIGILLIYLIGFLSCKKAEHIITEIQTPQSSFGVLVNDANLMERVPSNVNYIDSIFYFENSFETDSDVVYQWDFGDGNNSNLKTPEHTYSETGKYRVQLICTKNELASDTSYAELTVILGQQEISIDDSRFRYNNAIDLLETNNSEFLLLGSTTDITVTPNAINYFLLHIDKNLQSKSNKIFSLGINLTSISDCNDGNYIFTGKTQKNTENNELIKMNKDGIIIWSKVVSDNSNFTWVQQTSDQGFIVVGSRNIEGPNNKQIPATLIVKTDENGNMQWEKVFEQDFIIENTFNTLEEENGYIVAGIKESGRSYGDSLAVVKLSKQGDMLWKNTIEWSLNTDEFGPVNTLKMQNGNYQIFSKDTKGLFTFSSEGKFLDRKLLNYKARSMAITNNGGFSILGDTFQRAYLASYNASGIREWEFEPNSHESSPHKTYTCCIGSTPLFVQGLKNGGYIFLSTNYAPRSPRLVSITKVDTDGKVM